VSEIRLDVIEDKDHREGGFALIRLHGLWLLPANAAFTIEPQAPTGTAPLPDGWPAGDLLPFETRLTPHGVEMSVGPEVATAAPLVAGLPVVVSVPAANIRSETAWPSIRPHIVPPPLTAAALIAELNSDARAKSHEPAVGEPVAGAMYAPAGDAMAEAGRELSQLRIGQSREPAPMRELALLSDAEAGGRAIASAISATAADPTTIMPSRPVVPPVLSAGSARSLPTVVPPRPKEGGDGAPRPGRTAVSAAIPFALGFVIAAALTGLVAFRQSGVGETVKVLADPRPVATIPATAAPVTLADVVANPALSPSGREAAGVDLATSLKLADNALQGQRTPAEIEEARYWLRRSIGLSIGGGQIAWAMTQLGTLYAEPVTGPPDYGKARLLWELAGESGDAQALCFLAALYEHGLGVAKSREQALAFYQRARQRDGCSTAESAIARLRN